MKKIFVTGIVLVIFIIYTIFNHNSSSAISPTTNRSTKPTGGSTNTSGSTSPSVSKSSSQGAYKDGTYTGAAADAFYGTIQVKAIVQNGTLSDVQFLQYPNDRQESVEINQQAMPQLKQEAIQAQSAHVDVVSGATQTSQAFQNSLADALAQAK